MPKRIYQTLVILLGILIALLVFYAIGYENASLGVAGEPVTHPFYFSVK